MPDDPILALKHQLAREIIALSKHQVLLVGARRLGIDSSRLCDLRHGRVARFSVERLIKILATVDRRVVLTVVCDGPRQICWFPKLRLQRRVLSRSRSRERRRER